MSALEEFLQRGVLPFVGRDAELARLVEFWRATPYAQGLRASLVQAEAGIGKSRLLDEVIRRVIAEEGAVIHVKLYPESSVSLAPLLAPALWHSNVGRDLLRTEPEATLPSVISALRRLSRLRPTLLVLEDTHLLSPDSTPEFASLLNALADETISLLCLCRPAEWRGRAVLEGYVVERIELEGLSGEAIARLWESLFISPCEPSVADLLHGATLGNALALRSVLRSAVDSHVITGSGERWRLNDRSGAFGALMRRNVEILSAGMVAHLNADELRAAGRFASLGEVFARETAEAFVDDAPRLLDALMAGGVIATTSMLPLPLGGFPQGPQYPVSARPLLVFTHTLLHKYLVEHAEIDTEGLIRVIGEAYPLYSALPFILVQQRAHGLPPTVPGMDTAAERSLFAAWLLDAAHDGAMGLQVWETAAALVDVIQDELSEEKREGWPLRLLQIRTSLTRYRYDERLETSQQFYDATRNARHGAFIRARLVALAYYLSFRNASDPAIYHAVWEELNDIATEFRDQRHTDQYLQCLASVADSVSLHVDFEMAPQIRQHIAALEMEVEQNPAAYGLLVRRTYASMLSLYRTPEELEDRNRMYTALNTHESETGYHGSSLRRTGFLTHTGRIREALDVANAALPVFRLQGDLDGTLYVALDRLMAQSALGRDLEKIEVDARALVRSVAGYRQPTGPGVSEWLTVMGLQRGRPEWAWRMYHEFLDERDRASASLILLHITRGDLADAEELLRAEWPPQLLIDRESYELMRTILRLLLHGEGDPEGVVERVVERLRQPVLRLYDTVVVSAVMRLLDAVMALPELASSRESLSAAIRAAVLVRLEWLAERDLADFMAPLLESFGTHMKQNDRKEWAATVASIRARRNASLLPDAERRRNIRVSMLGTIQVAPAGGDPAPLRGVRIRTLLGLMVADKMIGASLTPQEFVLLAGEDDDPELARKKRNMGVVRLREIMGADAILTDGRTPRLNPDIVEVDLLRADELVKRSLAAAREGAWVRAYPLLMEALELTGGDVPFPTLYESFFEAARDDFEFRLRSAVLDVARGLLREGDTGGAEDILRHAFAAMPDDEEIAELLRDALIARGKRVEAERIRLRAKEGAV